MDSHVPVAPPVQETNENRPNEMSGDEDDEVAMLERWLWVAVSAPSICVQMTKL